MAQPKIKLYSWIMSPACRSVEVLLKIGKIEAELSEVNYFDQNKTDLQFLKDFPKGTTPAIIQGNLFLEESNAIMKLLCRVNEPRIPANFFPKNDPQKRALIESVLQMMHIVLLNPINDYYAATSRSKQTGKEHEKRVRHASFLAQQGLQQLNKLLKKFQEKQEPQLRKLFIFGNQPTIADLRIGCALQQLFLQEDSRKWTVKFTRVVQFYESLLQIKEFKEVQESFLIRAVDEKLINQPDLQKIQNDQAQIIQLFQKPETETKGAPLPKKPETTLDSKNAPLPSQTNIQVPQATQSAQKVEEIKQEVKPQPAPQGPQLQAQNVQVGIKQEPQKVTTPAVQPPNQPQVTQGQQPQNANVQVGIKQEPQKVTTPAVQPPNQPQVTQGQQPQLQAQNVQVGIKQEPQKVTTPAVQPPNQPQVTQGQQPQLQAQNVQVGIKQEPQKVTTPAVQPPNQPQVTQGQQPQLQAQNVQVGIKQEPQKVTTPAVQPPNQPQVTQGQQPQTQAPTTGLHQLQQTSVQANVPNAQTNVPNTQVNVPSAQVNAPNTQVNVPSAQVNVPSAQVNVPSAQANITVNQVQGNVVKEETKSAIPAPQPVNPELQKYEIMVQEVEKDSKDGWTQQKSEKNITLQTKPYSNNWAAFSITTDLAGKNITQVLPYFTQFESIKKWKENLKALNVLKEIEPDLKVLQEQLKVKMITDREFVYMQKIKRTPNLVVIYEKSFIFPGTENPSKGHERGDVLFRKVTLTETGQNLNLVFQGSLNPRASMAKADKFASMAFDNIVKLKEVIMGK